MGQIEFIQEENYCKRQQVRFMLFVDLKIEKWERKSNHVK